MNVQTPALFILVGITGDLSKRKLLPAISNLAVAGLLPEQYRILGITRRKDVFIDSLLEGVTYAANIRENIELFPMSLTDPEDYERLRTRILDIEKELGTATQHIWYLSVPPQSAWPIIEQLGTSGLAKAPNTKLLLEKPFGVDEKSAHELAAHIEHSFRTEDVYRVDHYLGKEAVRNFIDFRRNTHAFENTWNQDSIERIDIFATENIDIEGRAVFYEQTGALRDVIQSHLLQLAAIILMKLPENGESIPEARLAALQNLQVAPDGIFRRQYEEYRNEVANPTSMVETFASITLSSNDPRWRNVPITLTAGKALSEKKTEIIATYRPEAVQGTERFTLDVQKNSPGGLDAYEHVFLAALRADRALFVSSAEIYKSWGIIDTVRKGLGTPDTLISYPKGAEVGKVLAKSSLPKQL